MTVGRAIAMVTMTAAFAVLVAVMVVLLLATDILADVALRGG